MGVVSSRQFRQALQKGDEDGALQLYHSREDLQTLNPSRSYGIVRKTSPIHYAAKRGFTKLFKEFLINGANPNIENYKKQSVVHEVCKTNHGNDARVADDRADMLQFLVDFCTNPSLVCPHASQPLKPWVLDMDKQDTALNTPLHLAATSGLRKCVEILLSHGARTHMENIAKQTPFDCAEASHHQDIMAVLEPKMVFSPSRDANVLKLKPDALRQESYRGMREQELQEIKDSLVLQMSSLLGVSLFNAAALLQCHGWSQELLINAWFEDPQAACEQAKIKPSLGHQASLTEVGQVSIEDRECQICTETITDVTPIPCGHGFCKACWKEYLELKISEGEVAGLQCPGFGCTKLVPIDVVASIVPREVDAKYLKFGIDAFVSASTNLQWCPHPGCGRAVCLPSSDTASGSDRTDSVGSQTSGDSEVVPRAVDCGMGHFFCWACGNEAHDPCDCELWAQWKDEVSKHDNSELISSASEASHQASSVAWISQHSKPCPNCKAPIERSDGCNHMMCSKCEHDFCWACLGKWSVHGSRTGGYFHCNRYRTARNVTLQLEKTREKASADAKKRSTKFFKHMLSRYTNHTESLKYEEGLLGSAKEKAAALIGAVQGSSAVPITEIDGGFVEDAVRELLKARSALRSTYAMSYYINSDSVRDQLIKAVARLEKSTEILAEMIARPHLCTPKDRIVLATVDSREIRRKFLPEARKLNPPKAVETAAEFEDEDLDPVDLNFDWDDSDYTDTDTDWDTDSTSS